MAIDFPATPTLNQQFTSAGSTWLWDGVAWNIIPQMTPATASDTPPANPAIGQLWWRASNGQMYIWYDDGNTRQWVQTSTAVAPVPGLWEKIEDRVITTGVPQSDFLNLDPFRKLRFSGVLMPSLSSGMQIRTSSNNGVSFDAGASDYVFQTRTFTGTTTTGGAGNTTGISGFCGMASDANNKSVFDFIVEDFNAASNPRFLGRATCVVAGALTIAEMSGYRNQGVARNALRFLPSNGGTITGSISIEGVRG